MYESIIVPLDLSVPHPAALGVAGALARRSGAVVRIVTVSSLGLGHEKDELELKRIAEEVDATDVRVEVVESNDVAAALLNAAGGDGLFRDTCLGTHESPFLPRFGRGHRALRTS